jgi:hypothetical protein
VVEGTTVDEGMGMVAPTIEEVGAEIVAPVTFVRMSLIIGEIMDSVTFDVVDGVDPLLLLLFPFELSISCITFLGGGLTISRSDL